ncbi:hypothetical protein GOBAR_DD18163 [Gossypium barbadense]|nr:hypothetical protein GOBAR_DD18163 [Gossypium barbadense]
MSNFFSKAEVTSSGRPVLLRNEVECHLLSAVDLEPEDHRHFSLLKSGLLILTTHRLIWLPSSSASTPTSASAIPLAAISHVSLPKNLSSPSSTPLGYASKSSSLIRGKWDCDGFLVKFWDSWRARAWETTETSGSGSASVSGSGAATGTGGGLYLSDGSVRMVGVAGILRKEQEMWESIDKSLQDAFQDLNALMSKAKEMVMLADKMRQKLLSGTSSQTSGTNDEDMGSKEEMQDWLLSVGIISPVTKESADFVRIPLERAGGMINLMDAYCLFDRARGTDRNFGFQRPTMFNSFEVAEPFDHDRRAEKTSPPVAFEFD